jgi:hypothetical protein
VTLPLPRVRCTLIKTRWRHDLAASARVVDVAVAVDQGEPRLSHAVSIVSAKVSFSLQDGEQLALLQGSVEGRRGTASALAVSQPQGVVRKVPLPNSVGLQGLPQQVSVI